MIASLLFVALNDKEIFGQAAVFLVAGYETTSVLLSFFFYTMAIEPVIQEKVYEEIRDAFENVSRSILSKTTAQNNFVQDEITYEKLQQLPYLDMVINETLRMYPPFTRQFACEICVCTFCFDRFERIASEDYQLGEYHLPKGMIISVPVYSLHHDPNVWPEPEKFNPERYISNSNRNSIEREFF